MRLLSVLLPCSFILITYAKVIQIQIVHRHGARVVIDKHETNPALEQNSPTLYPQGIKQLQTLGTYCRKQYIETGAPLAIDGINDMDTLSQQDIISTTSNFQRTQLSARAFLSTLFPDHHKEIPTLVFNGTETDWIIRGYAICPTLAKRFQDFVSDDPDFKKRKDDNNDFVKRLAKNLNYKDEDATFENVFNVYDEYNIIHKGYDPVRYAGTDKLPDTDMKRLKEQADWYESHKFSYATHNVHVAAGLLTQIMQHIRTAAKESSQAYRIVHFSAHYPTLLTLLASLRSQNPNLEPPADQIPEFGAALIFEVHEEDGEILLRMKWFRGGDDEEKVDDVAIGRDDCTDPAKGCKLSSVEKLLASNSLDTSGQESFCGDCQSTSGVCSFVRQNGESGSSQVETGVCSIGVKATSGAIGAALVLVVGLVIWLLHSVCIMKRKRMERGVVPGLNGSGYDGEVFA